jgi:hypothetical protein
VPISILKSNFLVLKAERVVPAVAAYSARTLSQACKAYPATPVILAFNA